MAIAAFVRQLRDSRAGAGVTAGTGGAGTGGGAGTAFDVPPAIHAVRAAVLLMVLITVPFATPNPHAGPKTGALTVALVACGLSWVIWELSRGRPRQWVAALALLGLTGGVLAGLTPLSTAVAVGFVVTTSAGQRLPTAASLAITAETIAAFLITGLITGADASALVGWSAGFAGMWAFGLTRRAYLLRAVEAEEALEQARRAQAAQAQAAALAERARIAREIHDVLAHSLAAVSVNLQAAEGLLEAVPDESAEVTKAMECVQRASALTKEGMAETRRAILALREDETERDWGPAQDDEAGQDYEPVRVSGSTQASGAGGARRADRASGAEGGSGTSEDSGPVGASGSAGVPSGPGAASGADWGLRAGPVLPRRLRALAEEHAATGDAAVTFTVTGEPRRISPEAALTAYRTAQEALTNARKHAPGQPITVALDYPADAMTLQVSNPLPTSGTARPLSGTGLGYGLTGLTERAALANGTLTAGPADGNWYVHLRIPA